jgi:hypothetical protein
LKTNRTVQQSQNVFPGLADNDSSGIPVADGSHRHAASHTEEFVVFTARERYRIIFHRSAPAGPRPAALMSGKRGLDPDSPG